MPAGRFAGNSERDYKPKKMCTRWLQGPQNCFKGADCTFAHGIVELHPDSIPDCGVSRFLHTGLQPTKICTFFEKGKCARGLACTFAHGEKELNEHAAKKGPHGGGRKG